MGICGSKEKGAAATVAAKPAVRTTAPESKEEPAVGHGGDTTAVATAEPATATGVTSGAAAPREVKILLLGLGESGKSTILKQMKILYQDGFLDEEREDYRGYVFRNVMEGARCLINAMKELHPEMVLDGAEAALTTAQAEEVLGYTPTEAQFLPEIAALITALYSSPHTQPFITQYRLSFYLPDSACYFFEQLPRITQAGYLPDVADILRTRKKTLGLYDTRFPVGELMYHMYDVGGQRLERKKWIHSFDNVTLIIFCVALSEYDQVLLEENLQNRLEELLSLFDSVVNLRWFVRSSIVLFLNKVDIFAEKIPQSPMENFFPDYTGGADVKKAAKYILWRFSQVNRLGLNLYPHVTQATETNNIELVFAAVRETILTNALNDSGIL